MIAINYQQPLHLCTPFEYATHCFRKKNYEKGFLFTIPIFGFLLASQQHSLHNQNVGKKIEARRRFVKHELESASFKVQALYFETYQNLPQLKSSTHLILSDSTPDRQIRMFIRDLKSFQKEENLSPTEIHRIKKCLNCLKKSYSIALLVSLIIESPSASEKKELVEQLFIQVHEQLSSLSLNSKMLIPCGYMNGNVYDLKGVYKETTCGHSILLEAKRTTKGYTLSFFDTSQPKSSQNYYPLTYKKVLQTESSLLNFVHLITSFSVVELYKRKIDAFTFYRKIESTLKKSYKKSGNSFPAQLVSSCAKECILFWLHQSMDIALFNRFHSYAIQRKLDAVQKLLKTHSFLFYRHPLAQLGWTKSASLPLAILQEITAQVTGRSLFLPLAKSQIKLLLENGKPASISSKTKNA